jgi:putative nucleotidyltransferase with HDIG domain
MPHVPTREQALEIFLKYNETDSLIKHGLAVEGTMKHFAKIYGEDDIKWGIVGLLHDLDYEKFPKEHCYKTEQILNEYNFDEEYIRAIKSHAYGICTDVEPISNMEKVLYTVDELTGLINATALMRPSKSLMDLEYKSVHKKYKTLTFAAGVSRDTIEKGALMLDLELKYVIEQTILGMRDVAESLGLK